MVKRDVPSRQNGEARREAILDAALTCFARQGLVHTGIEDIRKQAKASPSSVYHFFGGLPEIIAALLERTFTRRFERVTAQVVKTRTAKSAVETMARAHLEWVFANEGEARFMYQALSLDIDGLERDKLRASKERLKAELLAHLKRVGALPDVRQAEALIDVALLGSVHQACRSWLLRKSSVDPKWMVRALPQMAWTSAQVLLGSSRSVTMAR